MACTRSPARNLPTYLSRPCRRQRLMARRERQVDNGGPSLWLQSCRDRSHRCQKSGQILLRCLRLKDAPWRRRCRLVQAGRASVHGDLRGRQTPAGPHETFRIDGPRRRTDQGSAEEAHQQIQTQIGSGLPLRFPRSVGQPDSGGRLERRIARVAPPLPRGAEGRHYVQEMRSPMALDHAHHQHERHVMAEEKTSLTGLAVSATIHCLTGCAIGEVLGMVIGVALGWSNAVTVVLSVALAFLFGYSMTLWPLLAGGMACRMAVGLALASDTLSITVMEITDNAVVLMIPGAMDAGLTSLLFWGSLALSLAVAFVAALPVNRWLLSKGRGHALVHAHHH